MKRDLELVREILLAAKDAEEDVEVDAFTDEDRDEAFVSYHFALLKEAGFVNATVFHADDKIYHAAIHSLTWRGHEFAEAVKSKKRWKTVKQKAMATCGSLSIDIISSLAIQMMSQQTGLM